MRTDSSPGSTRLRRNGTDTGRVVTGHRVAAALPGKAAADALRPFVTQILGGVVPVRFEFWDGSAIEPTRTPSAISAVVRVHSVDAIRRILWAPGEIGLARAFVAGDIEIDGDIFATLRALSETSAMDLWRLGTRSLPAALHGARGL